MFLQLEGKKLSSIALENEEIRRLMRVDVLCLLILLQNFVDRARGV